MARLALIGSGCACTCMDCWLLFCLDMIPLHGGRGRPGSWSTVALLWRHRMLLLRPLLRGLGLGLPAGLLGAHLGVTALRLVLLLLIGLS